MSDHSLEEYAQRQRLRAASVERLQAFDDASRQAILALAVPLGINDNQLRDVVDLLEDTAARSGGSIADVLHRQEIAEVCGRAIGRSDKIKALKACLRRLRYPQLTSALERIDSLRDSLELPRGVRMELPENLEGDEVVVTLRADSSALLRSQAAGLVRAFDRAELDELFEVWQESDG